MKNLPKYFILIGILTGCLDKDEIAVDQIIVSLTADKDTVLADGTTTIEISAILNPDGDESFRTINFETDKGVFVETSNSEITKVAELNPEDSVQAKVVLRAPSTQGTITIHAQVELKDQRDRYIKTATLYADRSEVSDFELSVNSAGALNDFASEVTITGTLKNSSGGNVSSGVKVVLIDTDAANSELMGRFGADTLTSGSDSQITTSYSPGTDAADEFVYIKAIVLDDHLNEILRDSVSIYVRTK